MHRRALPFPVLVPLGFTLVFLSCGSPAPPSSGTADGPLVGVRPGDRLLDLGDVLRVERFPAANLPDDLMELHADPADTVLVRSDPVPLEAWDYQSGQVVAAQFPGVRLPGPDYRMFWCEVPLDAPAGSPPPTIVKNGRRQDSWDRKSAFQGSEAFWYDDAAQTLWCDPAASIPKLCNRFPHGFRGQ